MALDVAQTRDLLSEFEFHRLFIEELGWSQPPSGGGVRFVEAAGQPYRLYPIAGLGGVLVFEVVSPDGAIPDAQTRRAVHAETAKQAFEHLLIFVDKQRTQSLWYWVKRESGRSYPRDHWYSKGQPGDLFLGKLEAMAVDLTDLEASPPTVVESVRRLQGALDVERVTRKFYVEFKAQHAEFLDLIEGIPDAADRRWYASVILNRLMFVYFLQRKGFVNDDRFYLRNRLTESVWRGTDRYYGEFLQALFFEGFAKPPEKRSPEASALIGEVPYLNGGLFLRHRIELVYPDIRIPDRAFENLFALFGRYSWNLNDTPGADDNEISPDVLGYIFEKYINQKDFGAYYTRPEITEYLGERTIHRLILDRVNSPGVPGVLPPRHFEDFKELLARLDAPLCRTLLFDVLPSLRLLDPACGSGAFLVAAMKTLLNVYGAVMGKINVLNDRRLTEWLRDIETHRSRAYHIKKQIITDNLYGVDLMEEATEIAKLRLFLALVSSAQSVGELEPLPNIDFNIMAGNSLVGLLNVDPAKTNMFWGAGEYQRLLDEKNRLVETYRHTASLTSDLEALRANIDAQKAAARPKLNDILLQDFLDLGIKYEQAQPTGKAIKCPLRADHIAVLEPFHWGYEFDRILQEHGGFDAIITNPPWEAFKPQAKEFFARYSDLVTKKKMTIEDFLAHQSQLLRDPETRAAWLEYQSQYPHVSEYYRNSPQYRNQISVVNGKRAGTDINLYKLFTEQCHNLLRPGGYCGIVIPSGIYTDLGTKQLREMLFHQTRVTGLFGFENRKEIFEGVHRSFKFVVLTYEKSGRTAEFPAAFMRHDVEELERFPENGGLPISVNLVRRLSPDSLSVMEFKTERDVVIAEKMLRFPLLGERIEGKWNLRLTAEFHMTNDSHLFRTEPGPGRLPLYEGKMIHQFTHQFATPRYWVDEAEGRKALHGRKVDKGQVLGYQSHRLGVRAIARNTDNRTLIVGPIPPGVFCGNSVLVSSAKDDDIGLSSSTETLAIQAILNACTTDFYLRQMVSANINMFYVYQLPVPRLGTGDRDFNAIVERAAKLICTTPEYDELAREAGLVSHEAGVIDPEERARLRAELDGMVAHLYGLDEEEFAHVLSAFPLMSQATKDAALEAYRNLTPKPGDPEVIGLIKRGEGKALEFKATARWNLDEGRPDKAMERIVIIAVASFLNSYRGGDLLIGVGDDEVITGLSYDLQTFKEPKSRTHDGYYRWLTDLLFNAYGFDLTPYVDITFHEVDNKDVCRVTVTPAPTLV